MIESLKIFSLIPYENIDEGVRMEYPSDWNITEHPYYGGGITFTNMEGSSFDISSSLYKNASLDQIVNQTISSYKELYSNSNFTLLNASSNSSNNGWFQQQLPSAMLNYSYIDNYNYDIKNNTEIITIYNDKVYSILFSADEPRYEENILDARQMIESLKIFSLIPYENIDEGVRMEYPSDWNITEHPYYGGGITFTNMEGSSFDTVQKFTLQKSLPLA